MIKTFRRFQRKEGIGDDALGDTIERAEQGLIDAELGGGLIKPRVGRPGQGRSRGFRTIIAYRHAERAVFLYGFAKSERDNIGEDELKDWRLLAESWLQATVQEIETAITRHELREIWYGEEDQGKHPDAAGNSRDRARNASLGHLKRRKVREDHYAPGEPRKAGEA